MLRRSAVVAALLAGPAACGSRTLDESPVGEGTSASPATGSTGAVDDTVTAPTTGAGASATGASTGGDTCLPTVEIGPFTQLSELGLGRMHVYDFDADGLADLVGSGGVIAYQRANGFEQVPSPEPIPSWCVPGRFDGDDTADLLFRISDDRLRLHLGGAAEPVVDTMIAQVTSLAPGDMDGDGIDDLVVGIDDAERIQTWRGSASGTFEMTATPCA